MCDNALSVQTAEEHYQEVQKQAARYFQILYHKSQEEHAFQKLEQKLGKWLTKHKKSALFSLFHMKKNPADTKNDYKILSQLYTNGQLNSYLNRSLLYIYMRDLGVNPTDPQTKEQIQSMVQHLEEYFHPKNKQNTTKWIDLHWLYQKAEFYGVEETFIWLWEKLRQVDKNMPQKMNIEQSKRKLMKLIAGVVMHEWHTIQKQTDQKMQAKQIDRAIRIGYAYGLTYPFIDDFLDAKILSEKDEKRYSNFIRQTLLTGNVPQPEKWDEPLNETMQYIYCELKEAFEYIHTQQAAENKKKFLLYAYIFFRAQEEDRNKSLENPNYSLEEIYVPIILKAAYSRLIVRTITQAPEEQETEQRIFYYGIYNQLADDFTDLFEDDKNQAVTPYTYYQRYKKARTDLLNPFVLYWTVIYFLTEKVYQSDSQVTDMIFCRIINSLQRLKKRIGDNAYHQLMQIFQIQNTPLNKMIQLAVSHAQNTEFLDKLLRDTLLEALKKQRNSEKQFIGQLQTLQHQINNWILFTPEERTVHGSDIMIDAVNYSLHSGGKRLRSILTWMMAIEEYGLEESSIIPILKAIEYMHTSSLIFDDLPSQDQADIRRGQPTLHKSFDVATAELAGIYLMQKAVEEETKLADFKAENVLQLIQYTAKSAAKMCGGQSIDLRSKSQVLTIDELNEMCFYKTGIAFEVALVAPAILLGIQTDIKILKQFAYHAGIAFQIKDDLLDVEGSSENLGKTIGKDKENNRTTFVSLLGIKGAKKQMWTHYCLARKALQKRKWKTLFMNHLLDYIIHRES